MHDPPGLERLMSRLGRSPCAHRRAPWPRTRFAPGPQRPLCAQVGEGGRCTHRGPLPSRGRQRGVRGLPKPTSDIAVCSTHAVTQLTIDPARTRRSHTEQRRHGPWTWIEWGGTRYLQEMHDEYRTRQRRLHDRGRDRVPRPAQRMRG
jgi:hypothetical protein